MSTDEAISHDKMKSIAYDTEKMASSSKNQPGNSIEVPERDAQAGVQKVEAITLAWSRTSLIIAYVLIWIVYFIMLLQQGAQGALNPYVTSAFQFHSLTPTVGIVSSVIGGVCNLTIAKILDVFGRPQGYAVSLLITTIGLIMMAATTSVEMYAAAEVFWTVGNSALLYSINIFVADTTALKNRGLMTALTSSANIITVWLAGPLSEAFLKGPGWRWCFGALSILVPILCLPLLVLLFVNYAKAKSQGLFLKSNHDTKTTTPLTRLVYYAHEFDVVGLLLLTAGLSLFLLAFNLWPLQPQGWRAPIVICFLVFGLLLTVLFALWEKYFATVTFIPFSLLTDRNMIGSYVLGATVFISYFCWNSYFSSFLQVVNGLSVTESSYIIQSYSLVGSLSSIATGVVIRYTGRFKVITLYFAIPIYVLFSGLMIYFRSPGQSVGYIVMCQIFIAIGSGVIIITPQIAAMSVASHQHVAVILAILSMFSSVGGAIGLAIAGAIWQGIFPVRLAKYLPSEAQSNALIIYSSLEAQLAYPVGTPTRYAIQQAYGDAQKMMLTASVAIWVIGIAAVMSWRNVNVKEVKQAKGVII